MEREQYKKQIADFLKMLECRLDFAFEIQDIIEDYTEIDRLYRQEFQLSFMGKSCVISFGATEYNEITEALKNILEEI